jgi:phosphoesterase RecJ-like protein
VSDWTAAWDCNTTPAELAGVLKGAKRVVCLTHSRPDGDAAGSTLAGCRALRHIGIDARACYVGPAPRWLPEMAGDTPYTVVPPGTPARATPVGEEPDVVLVTDTGTWTQLAEFADWLRPLRDRTIVADHHLHGDPDVARWRLVRTTDAASTQVIAPLCAAVLERPANRLPRDVADALYLGLATDTQWFRLSNVSPPTLRLAADLLECGVDHTRLYEMIEQQDTPGRWRLLGRALSSLELHADGAVAFMRLTLDDFAQAGADRNDTGGFADMVQHIGTVRVAVILTESDTRPGEPPTTKVSMRSKPGPDAIDVNALTRALGGGGHARAAGAKMVGVGLDEAKRRVLALLTAPRANNQS